MRVAGVISWGMVTIVLLLLILAPSLLLVVAKEDSSASGAFSFGGELVDPDQQGCTTTSCHVKNKE